MITDACGDVSDEAHERAVTRMVQAGARPLTALQYLLELQRDWARGATYGATTGIAAELGGAYGLGIIHAESMFNASEGGHQERMKRYLLSLGVGVLVGIRYSVLNVRSPAPPIVARIGHARHAPRRAGRPSRAAAPCGGAAQCGMVLPRVRAQDHRRFRARVRPWRPRLPLSHPPLPFFKRHL